MDYEEYLKLRAKTLKEAEERGIITPDKFYEQHKACPECNSTKGGVTYAGPINILGEDYVDNINFFTCANCGWHGKIIECVPIKN